MHIHRVRFLRRLIMPVLQRINVGDITIRHHWTGERLTLDFFKHKGYWYHGKRREMDSMARFAQLVAKGDFVLEIGGHIGYMSMYLAQLAGADGRLIVFEPAPNNLPYLIKNSAANPRIRIEKTAVTDYTGSAQMHIENLTGQNNSLLDHYSVREKNEQWAYVGVEDQTVTVPCTTLDEFLQREGLPTPGFIKIDVEGVEHSVLRGMPRTLQNPEIALMVEVTEKPAEVFSLLESAGFQLFRPDRTRISHATDAKGNVFCIKPGSVRDRCFTAGHA